MDWKQNIQWMTKTEEKAQLPNNVVGFLISLALLPFLKGIMFGMGELCCGQIVANIFLK